MPTKTERSILPQLENDQIPDDRDNLEEEVKDILRGDLEEKAVSEHDLQYHFKQETERGAEYELVNEADLDLSDMPGMESTDEDYSVLTDNHKGIEKVGVSSDGKVTIENQAGNEETYLLAIADKGVSIIKDQNNNIWRYNSIDDKLEYNHAAEDEWIESTTGKHKAKIDKVAEFQQQLWAVNRAKNSMKSWNRSSKDQGRISSAKQTFDYVMQKIQLEGNCEFEDNEHVPGNGKRGRDIGIHFDKARDRFKVYSLVEYGIDPLEEINVSNDKMEVSYEPRKF